MIGIIYSYLSSTIIMIVLGQQPHTNLELVESPSWDLWSIYHKISVKDPTAMATPAREDALTLGNIAAMARWVEDICWP